jgi:hypothetical protein
MSIGGWPTGTVARRCLGGRVIATVSMFGTTLATMGGGVMWTAGVEIQM